MAMVQRTRCPWFISLCLVCSLLAGLLLTVTLPGTTAHASGGTSYYINNSSGSGCNDSNSGTSASQPWCDFTPINNATLNPGDHVLLACGASWTQPSSQTSAPFLTLSGTGTSSSNIVLDAYDPGNPSSDTCSNRPQVFGNGSLTSVVVWINSGSYWTVQNLELGHAVIGLRMWYTTLDNTGLVLNNIFVHDVTGIFRGDCNTYPYVYTAGGIRVDVAPSVSGSAPDDVLQNVQISNIEGTHNQGSLDVTGYGCNGNITNGYDIQNITMSNLYLHDDNGPAPGCSDGMQVVSAAHVLIYDSYLTDESACYTNSGTAAIFYGIVSDVSLVNSRITNVPNTGSPDQTGIDYEIGTTNVREYDDYIAGNAGPGIELLAIHGSSDTSTGTLITNNLFVNNGQYGVSRIGSDIQPTGTIANNLYSQGTFTNADPTYFTLTPANLPVAQNTITYNAANDFSGSQGTWEYQYSNNGGSTWSNMTYNTPYPNYWGVPGVQYENVNTYGMHPGPCSACVAARTWIAPYSGVISLRGRAFKTDTGGGDGVGVTVLHNGTAIVPRQVIASTDMSGVDTNADNISVQAGDAIRFVLDNNTNWDYDSTSWDPSIVYTSASASCNTTTIPDCSFETPSLGTGNYSYGPDGGGSLPGAAWTFTGYSGISANNSAFTSGNPNAPDGAQVGVIQGNAAISQSISLQGGTSYTLTFEAAQRGNFGAGNQDFQVLLDGTVLGTFTPTGTSYATYSTTFTTTTGSHSLKFQGLDSGGGDRTAFIDNIALVP